MPTYSFRCTRCGSFKLTVAMADIVETPPCPACAAPARRIFGSPYLTGFSAGQHRLAGLAAASAEQPMVTRTIPPAVRSSRQRRRDPRTASLPRI